MQQSHEFEVANLMAENMLLREKLGLKSTEHTQRLDSLGPWRLS